MASRRYKYRHRSRPAAGEVRAVLDGYAALSGTANAHTTGANADKCAHGLSALPASATVPGVVSRLWEAAALTLVALDARGFPVPEARSTVGRPIGIGGAVFRAGDRGDVGAVTVQADDEGRPHANGWLETPWLEVLGGTER